MSRWIPILDGELGTAATSMVTDLAQAVRAGTPTGVGPPKIVNLANGRTGMAMFLEWAARTTGDDTLADAARDQLELVSIGMAEVDLRPGLLEGFTGIGWTYDRLFEPDAADPIDDALAELVARDSWDGLLDLAHGLVGYATYLADRPQTPVVIHAIERASHHLATAARARNDEVWWTTPAWTSPDVDADRYPPETIDLRMPHGVAGIASFLASTANVLGTARLPMLRGALQWLWNQRSADGAFPSWIKPDGQVRRSQQPGWSDGDLGIAFAFLHGARALDDEIWRDRGLSVVRHVAHQDPGVRDPFLCNGAASMAHLFNRAFQATGEPDVAEAARIWYRRLLAMAAPGAPFAGYAVPGDGTPRSQLGFLYGIAGVGLALLAGSTDREPAWDRVLLTALPPGCLRTAA